MTPPLRVILVAFAAACFCVAAYTSTALETKLQNLGLAILTLVLAL